MSAWRVLRLLGGAFIGLNGGAAVGGAIGSVAWGGSDPLGRVFTGIGIGMGAGALIGLVATWLATRDLDAPGPKREQLAPHAKTAALVIGIGVAVMAAVRPFMAAVDSNAGGLFAVLALAWGFACGAIAATASLMLALRVTPR